MASAICLMQFCFIDDAIACCEQKRMVSRWSQILLGARGFAFSRFRRASAAWRRLGAFALSRETALARENADFSCGVDELAGRSNSVFSIA